MARIAALILVFVVCAHPAEVRTLTLREAVETALKQGPDILLARYDERKAEDAVRMARAPFIPRVVVGSGLAYSSGFPMSIEGATPSILQANGIGSVFNRPQSLMIGAAKESRRGAGIDTQIREEDAVFRVADTFLEAEKAAKIFEVARKEVDSLSGVLEAVKARVSEGRELPIEVRKAELNVARARYRTRVLETSVHQLTAVLGTILGFDPDVQVQPDTGERPEPVVPESADAAVREALSGSKEIRSLESKRLARSFNARSQRAARLPRLDLVAQYGLLAEFNNYQQFFKSFQRHNGQLGISFQVPLWNGPAVNAAASQDDTEAAQLGIQIRNARSRIAADTRKAYDDLQQAEAAQQVARLDLEVAREQVSLLLAQMQEGRTAMRQIEEARTAEIDKWIALYDAAAGVEKAKLAVLRQTGGLLAALR